VDKDEARLEVERQINAHKLNPRQVTSEYACGAMRDTARKARRRLLLSAFATLIIIAVFLVIFLSGVVGTTTHPPSGVVIMRTKIHPWSILFLQPDGKLIKATIENKIGTNRGIYFDRHLYTFDHELFDRTLYKVDICGRSAAEPVKGMESFPYNKFRWLEVIYVDDKKLFFTATSKKIFRKKRDLTFGDVILYKLDMLTNKYDVVKLNYAGDGISALNDRIYYSDREFNIHLKTENSDKKIGLKGVDLSISPNGRYLAFMGYSDDSFRKVIYLHDFQTNETERVARNFSMRFDRKIKWSPDSRYFIIWDDPEIYLPPLKIIEASTSKVVAKIYNFSAYNVISESEYKRIKQKCNFIRVQEVNGNN